MDHKAYATLHVAPPPPPAPFEKDLFSILRSLSTPFIDCKFSGFGKGLADDPTLNPKPKTPNPKACNKHECEAASYDREDDIFRIGGVGRTQREDEQFLLQLHITITPEPKTLNPQIARKRSFSLDRAGS